MRTEQATRGEKVNYLLGPTDSAIRNLVWMWCAGYYLEETRCRLGAVLVGDPGKQRFRQDGVMNTTCSY